MLSKERRFELRNILFRHLDGIGTAPSLYTLHEKGVLDYLLQVKEVELTELSNRFDANEGYLNVALRILCSQGWLIQDLDNEKNIVRYRINDAGEIAFGYAYLYEDIVHLLKFSEGFHHRKFEKKPFMVLEKIFEKYKENYGLPLSEDSMVRGVQDQMMRHIEGVLVGPTIVHLGMSGMFHKYFMEASFRPEEFHSDPESFKKILDMFAHLGWFEEQEGTYQFTEIGLFYAKRASAYGVTVSYIPMFRKLDDLVFGDQNILRVEQAGHQEIHVDREMNVWGSGGAHAAYFKVVDQIIVDLFNRPIQDQPRGILDMGCGNGAFLKHIFELIENHTKRGEVLADYPLFLIGADYNEEAQRITKKNLVNAEIWAKVIWGDIGDPNVLANDIKRNYGLALEDFLNVRTFLDHNRIWQDAGEKSSERISNSTGAYAYRGARLSNNEVEDSLLKHLKRWEPFVSKFGLLIIELHTISPLLAAENIGRTAVTAYDATHGYSDQYIVESEIFIKIAEEAGLHPVPQFHNSFPDSELATVTINLLQRR